ncbi:FemAB family XrtA/PEP-CTERM system-associated protein [Lentisalinibacter sediminis]|uniref:FemAB family XrtA/PEP-CTERM system-associated protein n=1 Tax=Lentisalinibacter sediminis TaxID=2992237 RepID=UPI003868F5BB
MLVRKIDISEADAWDACVAACPGASLYHRYAWRAFFADYFGKETEYLAAIDSAGSLEGVLPLVRLQSRLFGNFYVSLPFVNYGGVLTRGPDAAKALLAEAADLARESGATHVEYRHTDQQVALPCRTDKVAMILELPESPEALGKAIGSKRRSQIKRPLREHPDVCIGGAELVDEFYAVFARNMRDLGTPVYAKSLFRFLADRFPDDVTLMVIRVNSRPAAAAFLLSDERGMEIPWASTVQDFNRISINMLLYWEVLKHAIESGKTLFDFGRSTVDSGTYRFKKQWGAEPVQLHWHYWLATGEELPRINPDNSRYRLAIRMWQKLPLAVANRLGPYLVRNLP